MPTIRLNKRNHSIKVVNRKDTIKLSRPQREIVFKRSGNIGPVGPGLPAGGTLGQVPYKKTDADYDIERRTPSLADKTYIQMFSGNDSLQVNHKLNKYPSVVVMDSAGEQVEASVIYIDVDNLAVNFAFPTSGTISCN